MSLALTVIYDDRQPLPASIEAIIGASRFSDILRRRVTLGEIIRLEVDSAGVEDWVHLVDDRDAHYLLEMIEASPLNRIFLRLPSCFMPEKEGGLSALIAKAPYALSSTLVAEEKDGEAPAFLTAGDAIALLRAKSHAGIREILQGLSQAGAQAVDHAGFVDLRRPEVFLNYMGNGTESRYFNATRVDDGVFRKNSTDREKMSREYSFFHVASEKLQRFLMPTFGFYDDGRRAGYAMEQLAVPDVALQFVHGAFDETTFADLVKRFFGYIDARPTKDVGLDAARVEARKAIIGKMDQRIDTALATPEGARLDSLLKEAGPCGGLISMRDRAHVLLERAIARDASRALAVAHGDPCFSNILYDRRTGLFRLVDPRGARTQDEAWMHPLYDLAKFSHSVLGHYDFINNDLFDVVVDQNLKLELRLYADGAPAFYRMEFKQRLQERGIDLFVVRAYELSLFLSMLPFHIDRPRKLVGFALIAADLIQDLEKQCV